MHPFFLSLNDSFKTICSQVLNSELLSSMSKLYGIIFHEERQQTIAFPQLSIIEATIFAATSKLNRRYNRFKKQYEH